MKNIFIKICSLNLSLLLMMSLHRLFFFLHYGKGLSFEGLGFDILKCFYMGLRFDAAVLGYINAPITIALIATIFASERTKFLSKLLKFAKWHYAVFFSGILLVLYIDFEFYGYFQDHLNILTFGIIDDDTAALLSTFNENYNFFLVFFKFALFCLLSYFLSWFFLLRFRQNPAVFPHNENQPFSNRKSALKMLKKIFLSIFLLLLNFAIIRGSFSMFPLGLPYAEVSPNAFINKTAINAFYTLEDAATVRGQESGIDYIEKAGYKDNIRAAFADYLGKDISQIPKDYPENSLIVSIPFNRDIEEMRPNVILIVMESFGSDLIKYQSAQFDILGSLKKHFDSDLLFMNFLPQHSVTIGSLESIITGIARKPRSAYLSQSKYVYNDYDFYGLKNYKESNYETLFFYGGNLGWRQLEPFMTGLGFDEVFGEGSMPSRFERNQWGVFDGYLFDFVFERFTKDDKRKFALILTMTNHPPFSLPKNYKAGSLKAPQTLEKRVLNKETAQKRYETYSYSADLLGRFIEKIKNSKYGENTIIAVTGDHNFWGLFQYEDGELLDSAGVPFYLYIPKKIKPEGKIDISVFGSHIDIMPTLYAISLSNAKVMQMGRNLLSKNASENIASQDTGTIMDKKYAVSYNFDLGDAAYFVSDKNNGRKVVRSDEKEGHLRLIKHYLSQTAIADYLIKNTGKQRAKK